MLRARAVSAAAGSMPTTRANRFHSRSGSEPRGGTVMTCTRSAGISDAQARSTSSVSCTFQNQNSRRSAAIDSTSMTSASQSSHSRVLRCLTVSCHSAGSSDAKSRTVTTTCTSAPASERMPRSAWSRSAAASNSCEITPVAGARSTCRASLSQAPLFGPTGSLGICGTSAGLAPHANAPSGAVRAAAVRRRAVRTCSSTSLAGGTSSRSWVRRRGRRRVGRVRRQAVLSRAPLRTWDHGICRRAVRAGCR